MTLKPHIAALAGALTLAGCAAVSTGAGSVREPSQATMTALQAGVTLADSLAFAYENLPSTTSAERVSTEGAAMAINAAWTQIQAGVAAKQPVSVTGLEAAISALESAASPRAVTANVTRANAGIVRAGNATRK